MKRVMIICLIIFLNNNSTQPTVFEECNKCTQRYAIPAAAAAGAGYKVFKEAVKYIGDDKLHSPPIATLLALITAGTIGTITHFATAPTESFIENRRASIAIKRERFYQWCHNSKTQEQKKNLD